MWRIYTVIGYFALALSIPICLASFAAWRRVRPARILTCPADGRAATVGLDGWYAVRMHGLGNPEFRVNACSCWPERAGCAQNCLAQLTKK